MVRYAFTKVGMTSIFNAEGKAQGVTVLKMQPAKVVRHEKLSNGEILVVVEYDVGNRKKLTRGWIVKNPADFAVGSDLPFPTLNSGEKVKITGLSKGRGFQDVVTKYGFAGGPQSHGSRFHRAPGSVGMRTEPGRVMKGRKMPGQDGNEQITLKNVKIAHAVKEDTVIAVLGGVPGACGSVVFL